MKSKCAIGNSEITRDEVLSQINIIVPGDASVRFLLEQVGITTKEQIFNFLENLGAHRINITFPNINNTMLYKFLNEKSNLLLARDNIIQNILAQRNMLVNCSEYFYSEVNAEKHRFKPLDYNTDIFFKPIGGYQNTYGAFSFGPRNAAWCPYSNRVLGRFYQGTSPAYTNIVYCLTYNNTGIYYDSAIYYDSSGIVVEYDRLDESIKKFIGQEEVRLASSGSIFLGKATASISKLNSNILLDSDFNGDGYIDQLIVNRYDSSSSITSRLVTYGLQNNIFSNFPPPQNTYEDPTVSSVTYDDFSYSFYFQTKYDDVWVTVNKDTYTPTNLLFKTIKDGSNTYAYWCSDGINVLSGDFDGDNLADLLCVTSTDYYMLFGSELNRNVFYSAMIFISKNSNQNGWMPDLHNWGNPYQVFVGDLDGNGYLDLLSIKNINNLTNIYIMFGTNDGKFISRTSEQSGLIPNLQILCGRSDNDQFLVVDFDGDGKDDIICTTLTGSYIFFSQALPYGNNPKINVQVEVNSIDISVIDLNSVSAKTSTLKVICNNTANPGSLLSCSANTKHDISFSQSFSSSTTSWLTPPPNINVSLNFLYEVALQLSKGNFSTSIVSTQDKDFSSLAKVSAESGECVVVSMTSKYVQNVPSTYYATITFTATEELGESIDSFTGDQLYNLARQIITKPISVVPLSADRLSLQVVGEISVDAIIENTANADNCWH